MAKRLKYRYHQNNTIPEYPSNYIFVFGSNLAGLHRIDYGPIAETMYGAETGIGIGFSGRSYALPVKDRFIRYLSLSEITKYINLFKQFTHEHPNKQFWITNMCEDKKGYKPYELGRLFAGCNTNCVFPLAWKPYLK